MRSRSSNPVYQTGVAFTASVTVLTGMADELDAALAMDEWLKKPSLETME